MHTTTLIHTIISDAAKPEKYIKESDPHLAKTNRVLKTQITLNTGQLKFTNFSTKIEACLKISVTSHKMQTLCFLSIVV
jgi:hypothetical protein